MTENFSDQKNNYKINSKANSPPDTTPILIDGKQVDRDSIIPVAKKTKIAYKKSPGADSTPIRFNVSVKGAKLANTPKHLSDSSSSADGSMSGSSSLKKSQEKRTNHVQEKKSPVQEKDSPKISPKIQEIKNSPIVNTLPSLVAAPIVKDTEKIPMKTRNIVPGQEKTSPSILKNSSNNIPVSKKSSPNIFEDSSESIVSKKSNKSTPYKNEESEEESNEELVEDEDSESEEKDVRSDGRSDARSSAKKSPASERSMVVSRSGAQSGLQSEEIQAQMSKKKKGRIDYNTLSPVEQAEKRIEFVYKLGKLRKIHKNFKIPEIEDHEDLNVVARKYEKYLEKTSITKNLGEYKSYLITGSLLIEKFGTEVLGMNFSGFAYENFLEHNKYDEVLYELGEKYYSEKKSNWPVEMRLAFVLFKNTVVFILLKYLSSAYGDKAKMFIDLIRSFSNGESQNNTDDNDGPTVAGVNVSNMIKMFGPALSNFNAGTTTQPEQARRRPAFHE